MFMERRLPVKRSLFVGFLVWLGASLLLRLSRLRLPTPDIVVAVIVLYGASFALMFSVMRWLLARSLEPPAALRAGVGLLLPTLVLDSFASAFFPTLYPNFPAASAGVFGGWMLICCAGGLLGAVKER